MELNDLGTAIAGIIGALLLLGMLPAAALAAGNQTGNMTGAGLASAAAAAECRSAFTVGVINSLTTAVPETAATLGQYATTLPADAAQLQTLAANKDVEGYKSYVQGTFNPDMQAAHQAIVTARQSYRGDKNVTKGIRDTLKNDYQNLQQQFQACHLDTVKQFDDAKVQAYNAELDQYQARADQLKAKGIDTTTLDQIITDARTNYVTPLQQAEANATDGQNLSRAVRAYCLFNGCKDGQNDHLAAKFEIQRLALLDGYFQGVWNLTADQVSAVQAKLSAASSTLSAAGTAVYQGTQSSDVWDNIKAAAQTLRSYQPKNGGGSR